MGKKTIYNPLEKLVVGGGKELSILDLFILDYNLFNDIKEGKLEILLDSEVIKFFDKCNMPNKKKSFHDNQQSFQRRWEVYNERRRNRVIKEVNQRIIQGGIEEKLVGETIEGTVQWTEKLNTHTDKTFSKQYICRYFDLKITFNVTGYKVEGKWRAYFELIWENEYADTSLFGGAFYSKLYKAVQDRTFSYNHKEENKYTKATISNKLRKQIEINYGDFVVRTNLFRCFYKDHLVEEIIGLLKIITPQGKEVTDKVACAYCSKCNCYYMLTSEYNRVSQKGIILCQLIDKDDYYKTGTFNRMNRVNESLLMQNGYNVKANVGLTDIQRQMILESIMEILDKYNNFV